MSNLIERLRDWQDYEPMKEFCREAIPDILEAAAEIETLHAAIEANNERFGKWEVETLAALSQEREAREKAERERGAAIARGSAAEADAELWQIQAEGKQAAEASLAEAKRLLKPLADKAAYFDPPENDDDLIAWGTDFRLGELRAARGFLSQDPNHER